MRERFEAKYWFEVSKFVEIFIKIRFFILFKIVFIMMIIFSGNLIEKIKYRGGGIGRRIGGGWNEPASIWHHS